APRARISTSTGCQACPASGFVIVMAGAPPIMQAMLDEVAPKLKIGVPTRRDREGKPQGRDRQLFVFRSAARAQHECGAAHPCCTEARTGQTRGRGHARASAASTIK